MEAATKNRRGRPIKEEYKEAYRLANMGDEDYAGRSLRTIRTIEAAEPFIGAIFRNDDKFGNMYHFFHSKEGRLKKTGIAEQLGRMISENLITEQRAFDIADDVITAYESGISVKTIERNLRRMRLSLKEERGEQ